MVNIKKILFATDLSAGSDYIMDYALSLAKTYGAEIHMLHVIHQLADMTNFYVPHISFDVIEKEMEEAARKRLEVMSEKAGKEGILSTLNIRVGAPHKEIIAASKELGVHMIVMGTHGFTAIDHIIFGSTAEKVVRTSSVPVLTIRPENI